MMVGPFWVVEEQGKSVLLPFPVPLEAATPYGDMLTTDTGHLEHWSGLARRKAVELRRDGIPTAPVWSEYDEWPRGRVLYDRAAQRYLIRPTHTPQPEFVRLIAERFRIEGGNVTVPSVPRMMRH